MLKKTIINNLRPEAHLAREKLHHDGAIPDGLLRAEIDASWRRSMEHGVLFNAGYELEQQSRSKVEALTVSNRLLIDAALPAIDYLAERQGKTGLIILANADATILSVEGRADRLKDRGMGDIARGACWSEAARGTNALGTALVEARTTMIDCGEHFLDRLNEISCAAVPIHCAQGNILGNRCNDANADFLYQAVANTLLPFDLVHALCCKLQAFDRHANLHRLAKKGRAADLFSERQCYLRRACLKCFGDFAQAALALIERAGFPHQKANSGLLNGQVNVGEGTVAHVPYGGTCGGGDYLRPIVTGKPTTVLHMGFLSRNRFTVAPIILRRTASLRSLTLRLVISTDEFFFFPVRWLQDPEAVADKQLLDFFISTFNASRSPCNARYVSTPLPSRLDAC